MGRRLLSHLLIMLAVFILTATFFMWTIDGRVLSSEVISGELRKAGVSSEFTKLLPEIVTADQDASEADKADMSSKISKAVSADYVDQKISEISSSVLTFVKKGNPQPVISLSDFPSRLEAVGVDAKGDFAEGFAKPILINEDGKMDNINKGYKIFSMVKYAGLALFAVIMLLEWFVAERGQKLKRVSRVFLYAGVSYFIYWLALIFAPSRLAPVLQKNVEAKYDTAAIIDAVLKAVQGLFSSYFLGFALSCFTIAGALYMVRHYKHRDFLPNVGKSAPTSTRKK